VAQVTKNRFALALVLVVGCAATGAPDYETVTIKLTKPDLIYVNGRAVKSDQLQGTLGGEKSVLVELDPEIRLSTLQSLQGALKALPPKRLEVKGTGRWIIDAVVEQRSSRESTR
jgi:hypothetical protein